MPRWPTDRLTTAVRTRGGAEAAMPRLLYSPECVEGVFSEVQLTCARRLAEVVSLPGANSSHPAATKKHPKANVPAG